MARASEQTLFEALQADSDHKRPDHDLACLYLQRHAQRVVDLFFGPRAWTMNRQDPRIDDLNRRRDADWPAWIAHTFGITLDLCPACRFSVHFPQSSRFSYPIESESVVSCRELGVATVTGTALEVPIFRGSEKYQRHIGFVDLWVWALPAVEHQYPALTGKVERRCYSNSGADAHTDSSWALTLPARSERVDGRERAFGIEVKTQPGSLGALIRQVKLYKEYADSATWIVATTFALPSAHAQALKNEGIHTLRLPGDFRDGADLPAVEVPRL